MIKTIHFSYTNQNDAQTNAHYVLRVPTFSISSSIFRIEKARETTEPVDALNAKSSSILLQLLFEN